MKRKINVITLGCSKNLVDSEHLMAQLQRNGFEIVHDSNETDARIVVINTCGFIGDAKEESVNTILAFADAKTKGCIDHLFVMGCLAERYREELREEIPEVDEYFGVNDLRDIVKTVGGRYRDELTGERHLTTPGHYAYLKISEGCNWGCGYCAIPLIRGRHVSVPMEELLREAEMLAARGVRELIVIAQDTTYYGLDLYGERRLGELLRRLCRIDGLEWVRLHYAYPAQFPTDVIDALRDEPKMCKYLDIPFQHISDPQLKSMRRGLNKAQTYELIGELRRRIRAADDAADRLSGRKRSGFRRTAGICRTGAIRTARSLPVLGRRGHLFGHAAARRRTGRGETTAGRRDYGTAKPHFGRKQPPADRHARADHHRPARGRVPRRTFAIRLAGSRYRNPDRNRRESVAGNLPGRKNNGSRRLRPLRKIRIGKRGK